MKEKYEEKKEDFTSYIKKHLAKGEVVEASVDHTFTEKEAYCVNRRNKIVVPNYNYKLFATSKRILQYKRVMHQKAVDFSSSDKDPFLVTDYNYAEISKILQRKINLLMYKEKTWPITLLGGLLVHLSVLGIIMDFMFNAPLSMVSVAALGAGAAALGVSFILNQMKKYIVYYVLVFNDNKMICAASHLQTEINYFMKAVMLNQKKSSAESINEKEEMSKKKEKESPYERLKEYILKARASGKTKKQIRESLKKVGWSDNTIDAYLGQEKPANLLKPSFCYIVDERKTERSFSLFKDHMKAGSKGLIISRLNPRILKSKYNLGNTKSVWLTDIEVDGSVEPTDFELIYNIIKDFLKNKDTVIVFDGLVYLSNHKGFNATLNLVQDLKDMVSTKKCRMIIPVNLDMLNGVEKEELKHELEVLEPSVAYGGEEGFF